MVLVRRMSFLYISLISNKFSVKLSFILTSVDSFLVTSSENRILKVSNVLLIRSYWLLLVLITLKRSGRTWRCILRGVLEYPPLLLSNPSSFYPPPPKLAFYNPVPPLLLLFSGSLRILLRTVIAEFNNLSCWLAHTSCSPFASYANSF